MDKIGRPLDMETIDSNVVLTVRFSLGGWTLFKS